MLCSTPCISILAQHWQHYCVWQAGLNWGLAVEKENTDNRLQFWDRQQQHHLKFHRKQNSMEKQNFHCASNTALYFQHPNWTKVDIICLSSWHCTEFHVVATPSPLLRKLLLAFYTAVLITSAVGLGTNRKEMFIVLHDTLTQNSSIWLMRINWEPNAFQLAF